MIDNLRCDISVEYKDDSNSLNMIVLAGVGKTRNDEEEGGVGVQKDLFLLLQTMVRSNNDVMQGNKDLMKSVLESSRTIRKESNPEENEVENQDIDPSTGEVIYDICMCMCVCVCVCVFIIIYMSVHV
jgi:hypothetical protein